MLKSVPRFKPVLHVPPVLSPAVSLIDYIRTFLTSLRGLTSTKPYDGQIHIDRYASTMAIPRSVLDLLHATPRQANILLFNATHRREQASAPTERQMWLVCRSHNNIDFVLSCANGPIGAYPICIFTPHPFDSAACDSFYRPRLRALARVLRRSVPTERVFSVFAFAGVSRIFAQEWQKITGLNWEEYYAAKQSYCTPASLQRLPSLDEDKSVMRLAVPDDIHGIAELCFEFAQDSNPFLLTSEEALKEAKYLVENKRVWVHMGKCAGVPSSIASIVAVTREGGSVSAITKVYTSADWRCMGYAERLTTFVCQELLRTQKSVVLYVGHDNAARSIYARVGFVGLDRDGASVPGVDDWLELGFDRKHVKLGHW